MLHWCLQMSRGVNYAFIWIVLSVDLRDAVGDRLYLTTLGRQGVGVIFLQSNIAHLAMRRRPFLT